MILMALNMREVLIAKMDNEDKLNKLELKKIIFDAIKLYDQNKDEYNRILNRKFTLSRKQEFNGFGFSSPNQNSENSSSSGSFQNQNQNQNSNSNNYNNNNNNPSNQNSNFSSSSTNIIPQNSKNPIGSINSKKVINNNNISINMDSVKKKSPPKKKLSLSKMPDKLIKDASTNWEPVNYLNVSDSYKLMELARVEINFDQKEQKLLYKIIEPSLTDYEKSKLEELKKAFIYVFERFDPDLIEFSGKDLIREGSKKLAKKYNIDFTLEQFKKINYYLIRDFLGLEFLEPIMHDSFIEDVSCDGLNVPIFVNHLKYGPLEVNRSFDDPELLNSFIVKLAQKSKKEVSLSKPIIQGSLPDGSRIEAIYGKEISEKGSSFTIRKFRENPFTPIHLIEFGTMPSFLLAYLWIAIENKKSLLVSGGTATGKTTILNALSLFVPPTSKIISIEDTPEINLPHEHWLPMISRETEGKAEVSMFDLLKASLRERPDYIIVGEIRGKEAAILFQGMATGHAGLGTVHADKFKDLVNRMTIDPINLPKQLLTELDLVIFMKQVKVKDNVVRRCSALVEVVDYIKEDDNFITNDFMTFEANNDNFHFNEDSAVISNLLKTNGGNEEGLWKELERRRRILDLMYKKKILEFSVVSDIIKSYYKDPTSIFEYIEKYENK